MEMFYLKGNEGRDLLALGAEELLLLDTARLSEIEDFVSMHAGEWIFLTLSYDLKQDIHQLPSAHEDPTAYPDVVLMIPQTLIAFENGKQTILKGTLTADQNAVIKQLTAKTFEPVRLSKKLHPLISKDQYLHHVSALKEELQYGNIYEINYCQSFLAEEVNISDEPGFFNTLNSYTHTPFAAYVHLPEHSVFCASPERFIQKTGERLISQPIKGTIKRGKNAQEDETLKQQLYNDPKERSENVMIVDLVRNDLSMIAQKASVNVDELFGIYSFSTVHQMISTISCAVKPDVTFTDILKATFPMGSMTGAPKRSAMELIEKHEDFKRGLYSGSIGYIDPNGDLDLNVVIRTLIYNRTKQVITCPVGSAITINADPEKEYDECSVKIHSFLDHITSDDQSAYGTY